MTEPNLTEFRAWLVEWDKADSTIYGYLATVRIFARWFAGCHDEAMTPVAVTPQDVRRYRDDMVDQKRSPNTINYHLSALSTYFSWAQDAGMIEASPTARVKQVIVQKSAPRWMDRREEPATGRGAGGRRPGSPGRRSGAAQRRHCRSDAQGRPAGVGSGGPGAG